ncbi:MAG: hypothetical protein GAK29_02275 [Acinetobacter bereziniae]|uniref:OmpW family protein n=1 Tax=Acinetobacter bereziniae TaxID=106648 RepID=A0A833PF76_ACIBZ|nr:MAG: hypothetical protein GAK29_02275 [Acinetobacter bereziniae]
MLSQRLHIKISIAVSVVIPLVFTSHTGYAKEFKRFSISAGWLNVRSTGDAQPFRINTSLAEKTISKVGWVSGAAIAKNVDQSSAYEMNPMLLNTVSLKDPETGQYALDALLELTQRPEAPEGMLEMATGTAEINGLSAWSANAGLEVENVNTAGLMFNYHINEQVSIQLMGGIPPKVDLKGQGQIYAPFSASSQPLGGDYGNLYLKSNLLVSNLNNYDTATSARAWTPALQAQYYFGKPGINKLRPFLGFGFMYAYFNDIEINKGVENDLIAAGHMIQNINDNQAGEALDGKVSTEKMRVKADASDAFAPIFSAGFTYDFKENWFATASV